MTMFLAVGARLNGVRAMRLWHFSLVLLVLLGACPSGDSGDRCRDNDACDTDLICVKDKCASPYARRWRLSVESARISNHDSNNDTWDGNNGAPDPFIVVDVDDNQVLRTQIKQDTLTPT